ncbi:lectin-like protein [Haloferula sp.]|uniref:C-type lectin domain-containing protein n=1 Tax=Haloferula sp. TaxID=2497595 RepID=UPI003C76DE5F
MKTSCPSCDQVIEISHEVLVSLAGQISFACPACQGQVEVPAVVRPRVLVASASIAPSAEPGNHGLANTHRGINRNLLIFGSLTLLVLGGVGFLLASQKSGDSKTIVQNIRNEIINNSYFTQLIASGVTSKGELEAIGEIRPYGDDFIGISSESYDWNHAQELASRTGARILDVGQSDDSSGELLSWMVDIFEDYLSPPVWILKGNEPNVLIGSEVLAVNDLIGKRRVFFRWDKEKPVKAVASNRIPYAGSAYQFIPGSFSWNEARLNAERMGGHLATINSKEENDWILKTFRNHAPKHRTHFWIGGKEETKGAGWQWVTGESFGFMDWNPGEPNDRDDRQPSYLNIYHAREGGIGWNNRFEGDGYEDGLVGFLVEWEQDTVDLLASVDPEQDAKGGVWKMTADGLQLESGQGTCVVSSAYVPTEEYDFIVEFSLIAESIGNVTQRCVRNGQEVFWAVQSYIGGSAFSGFQVDRRPFEYANAKIAQPALVKGVRYRSVVQVRRGEIRGFLNDELLIRWVGDLKTGLSPNSANPISFGAYNAGIIFHKAEIIRHLPESSDIRLDETELRAKSEDNNLGRSGLDDQIVFGEGSYRLLTPDDIAFSKISPKIQIISDNRAFPLYKSLWGEENVFCIHPTSGDTPGTVDFSKITGKSKGNLIINMRDDPRGDCRIEVLKGNEIFDSIQLDTDEWKTVSIPFEEDRVVIKVYATGWSCEYAFITYEISH